MKYLNLKTGKKILILFLLFLFVKPVFSQYSDDQVKTAFIYKFAQQIEWINEIKIQKFNITVLGKDTSIMQNGLRVLENLILLGGKEIDIVELYRKKERKNQSYKKKKTV